VQVRNAVHMELSQQSAWLEFREPKMSFIVCARVPGSYQLLSPIRHLP